MTSISFYFQVHQPFRLSRRPEGFEGNGKVERGSLFDDGLNRFVLERVAERCYLPTNRVLLDAIEESEGRFRCAFALTGTVLDQLEAWSPEALESFQELVATGCVEVVCETSQHSLAALIDPDEFSAQVEAQRARLETLFGVLPVTFRNTELIFDEDVARRVEELGFEVLLGEGADQLLLGRSARQVYRPAGCDRLKLLLRDYLFSDDIAFRFSNREWESYPLMADTFVEWLRRARPEDAFIGLYMDYETFGEHQDAGTGVLDFLEHVPRYVLEEDGLDFATPIEVARAHAPVETIDIPRPISWADEDRDLSAWLKNPMQRAAHEALYALRPRVLRASELGQPELLRDWRRLTTSDHVYYMSTAHESDGDVHEYFSPYDSPHDSFMVFMNVLDDLEQRVEAVLDEDSAS